MSLTAKVQIRLSAEQTGNNSLGAERFAPLVQAALVLADGTGANQVDLMYANERPVASATNDDLDLAGGLTDEFGATLTFAEIVAVAIVNVAADGTPNTTALTVGAGSAPWFGIFGTTGDQIIIPPGGMFLMANGGAAGLGAVTPTTADILRIANGSGAVNKYQIAILGRSA